jgi:DHA3 family macrolide efflux protein-like MFS transporter
LKNFKPITLLLIANAISGISQGITMIAIPWYFTGILHQEGLFGSIYFFVTAVSLFWGIYAGALIDRYDRRKLFLAMNLAGLFTLGGIAAYGFFNHGLNWWMVAIPFAATAFIYNIHFPNLYAFAQEITPKEDYAKVNSLLEIQGQISFTRAGGIAAILLNGLDGSGYSIGSFSILKGFVVKPWNIYEIFFVDALTYIVSLAIIYAIKTLPSTEKKIDTASLVERLKTGFGYLNSNPVLLRFGFVSLSLFLAIIIFSTFLSPMYVDLYLGKGGDVYALADMTFSFGALLAGFLTARLVGASQSVRAIMAMLFIAGVMHLVMVATKVVAFFYLANFVIGFCNAGVRILRVTYLFNHIPNHIIGRSTSVFFVLNVLGRLVLIGLFSLPFFHTPSNILIPMVVLAAICFGAVIFIQRDYHKL